MNLPLVFVIVFEVIFLIALVLSAGFALSEVITGALELRAVSRRRSEFDAQEISGVEVWGWVQFISGLLNLVALVILVYVGLVGAKAAADNAAAGAFPVVLANIGLEIFMLLMAAKSALLLFARRWIFRRRR